MIGDFGVGKLCFFFCYVDFVYREVYFNMIGVDFKIKMIKFGGKRICF